MAAPARGVGPVNGAPAATIPRPRSLPSRTPQPSTEQPWSQTLAFRRREGQVKSRQATIPPRQPARAAASKLTSSGLPKYRLSVASCTIPDDITNVQEREPVGDDGRFQSTPLEPLAFQARVVQWSIIWEYLPAMMRGLAVTLQVSAISEVVGIGLGLVLALCRLSQVKPLRLLAIAYIDFLRGIPVL